MKYKVKFKSHLNIKPEIIEAFNLEITQTGVAIFYNTVNHRGDKDIVIAFNQTEWERIERVILP